MFNPNTGINLVDPDNSAGPADDDCIPTKSLTMQTMSDANDKSAKRARLEESGESLLSLMRTAASESAGTSSSQAQAVPIIPRKPVPILARDANVLLLDIEGSMTSLAYVNSYMQQFVLDGLESHMEGLATEQVVELAKSLEADMMTLGLDHAAREEYCKSTLSLPLVVDNKMDHNQVKELVKELVRAMTKHHVRKPGMLSVQGAIWRKGKENGTLEGHIYPDFIPTIKRCKALGVTVCVFAAAPAPVQKYSFGTSSQGDLTPFISSYFDTSATGPKNDPRSYKEICKSLGVSPSNVLFLSVDKAELRAAKRAGLGFQVERIRPANWSVPLSGGDEFPVVHSMLKLLGSG